MTGWDELYGIASDPRVQVWHQTSDQPGTIFSWCSKMYWDQSNRSGDTGTNPWCVSQITLQDVYTASPQVSSPNSHAGVEGCFWGDVIIAANDDRQLFPRTAAEAEIGWTAMNNWTGFISRVAPFSVRFNLMGISWYTNENLVTWQTGYAQYRDSSDTSAFSGFMPALVPVDTIRESFIIASNSHRPPALASGAHYRVFDLRGRLIGVSDGRGLENAVRSRVSPEGVYFIVEEKSGNARKILNKFNREKVFMKLLWQSAVVLCLVVAANATTPKQAATRWAAFAPGMSGKIVYGDTATQNRIYVLDLVAGATKQIAKYDLEAYKTVYGSCCFRWSPSGKRIMTQNYDSVNVLNEDGTNFKLIAKANPCCDMIWGDWDGDSAIVYSTGKTVVRTAIHTDNTPGTTTVLVSTPPTGPSGDHGYTCVGIYDGNWLTYIDYLAIIPLQRRAPSAAEEPENRRRHQADRR